MPNFNLYKRLSTCGSHPEVSKYVCSIQIARSYRSSTRERSCGGTSHFLTVWTRSKLIEKHPNNYNAKNGCTIILLISWQEMAGIASFLMHTLFIAVEWHITGNVELLPKSVSLCQVLPHNAQYHFPYVGMSEGTFPHFPCISWQVGDGNKRHHGLE